ncbi:RND multidrug efflux transporter, Acriflavin resistance protein [Desulfurella amilsii]|uniref:RND multidrug efflux transporter, Acriflavin resistance protein n=1 Tax=Desulfurella amilsii TaxID=1562698 RepID=A0A1X4XYS0_9BACT|nr:efflux RND transporter permease subunit [Desulfurella amilsii]OSS42680.1 RND multidrug efflux transporter, Acriflavin resistance protein [Desulfurella amilsii]
MKFTDIFIKKPVLSIVVSLVILFLGLRSITELGVRQFPKTEDTLITVQTAYPGASAEVVQGFITTPLERAIASAEGIDYMTSSSSEGVSTINVYMKLNYNPNAALSEVLAQVNSVLNQLPKQAQLPVITKTSVTNVAYLYLAFTSNGMSSSQMTDYINRVIVPQIQAVNGVGQVMVYGNKTFAMRVWLNPTKMAEFNITPLQAQQALASNNYISATGYTKSPYIQINISTATDLHTVDEFKNLVVANYNGTLIRLKDIAKVKLGSINYSATNIFNDKEAIVLGIFTTPTANPLTVVDNIDKILPSMKTQLPTAMNMKVAYDRTTYIKTSIDEVVKTVLETLIVVIAVIFLFLGSYRSVIIPVIAIPLSIVGGMFMMFLLGYTINLLTLLAMVLAIGLVVDDAIIVVENVDRHISEGKSRLEASLLAARELGVPILAMSITLVAVFLPIGFMSGLTGALFKEFAFTLAGDVIISGIVALTLSPMLSSKFLKEETIKKGFVHFLDKQFDGVRKLYTKILKVVFDSKPVVVFVIIVVLTSAYFLFITSKSELAPTEDQGAIFVQGTGAPTATLNDLEHSAKQIEHVYKTFPELQQYFMELGFGSSNNALISGFMLKPWNERKKTQMEILPYLQEKLSTVPGLQIVAFPLPSLPGSQGLPVQFVIMTTSSYEQLYQVSNELIAQAMKSGLFAYIDSDLKYDQPQIDISIDRSKALSMDINMQTLGDSLSTLLSENYINWFSMQGYSYKVIPQVLDKYRFDQNSLKKYYIAASNGQLVPLSSIITLKTTTVPEALNRFNQQNSATISATMKPGVTLGQALNYLENLSKKIFPQGYTYNFSGQSRQFVQEGSSMLITFIFALVIIYLVLAALFESFIDPLIILISVPMSITGALIFLSLGFATVNIYTEVGLVTLIGLVSKHGILIVKFANDLQDQGIPKKEAIEQSAQIRLRPILMTTAAMVFGVVPLLLATGAGAASRFDIGLVIASGLGIGTFLTIFIVPTVYLLIGKDISKAK